MARVTTAQTRRRQRRAAAAKAASKPKTNLIDVDALAEYARQPDNFAEIARLAAEALPPADVRARQLELVAAAGLEDTPSAPQTSYELTQGSLAERKFLSEAIAAGYTEQRSASWPSDGALEDHGEVLYRAENEGVFRLDDGTIVYAAAGHGWFRVNACSPTRVEAAGTVEAFAQAYPPLYRDASGDGDAVPITFWTDSKWGPTSRLRVIDSASWEDIEGNYSGNVRAELDRLMTDFEPGKDGQLLLWQGSPGTGKTWALRALASEWRAWAEFSYITDPDAFFVDNPAYMIDVLLHDSYESLTVEGDVVTDEQPLGKWRVLILEDTGELLSANAKEAYGQGLSRLLNVVDGMVGQGLRVLALVTTNDELGDLHPAAVRPGRCASQLSFGPLSADEATAWGIETDEPMTLAELYAAKGAGEEAFAARADCANCDHAFADHLGTAGPCTMADCSCNGYDAPEADTAAVEDEPDEPAEVVAAAEPETMPFTLQFLPDGMVDVLSKGPLGPAHLAVLAKLAAGDAQSVVPTPSAGAEVQIVEPEKAEPVTAGVRWTAIFCPEGSPTDDGRVFAPGSITWRELPLTLMGMIETAPGHDGATVCGRIDSIWKQGGLVLASGVFDTGEFGSEIARLVGDGTLRGLSVDIAITELDVTYKSEVIDKDGNWIGGDVPPSQQEAAEGPDPIGVMFDPADSPMYVVWGGVIGAATVCPFPAFGGASIEIDAPLVAGGAPRPMLWRYTLEAGFVVTRDGKGELLASAAVAEPEAEAEPAIMPFAPLKPPAGWFTNPQLGGPTPLTIDDDGHIYGHAAEWDVCHIGIPGVCTTAPESKSGYALYHLKEVECAEGERVSVGTITFDTGHAGKRLSRADALAHYDHTGSAVADVVVGEDEFGIWFAGAMRPTVTEEQLRVMRGAVLSGDWRNVDGDLELVALLAVNVPGFPVKRVHALVASGADGSPEVLSLIAAGIPDGTLSALHRAELQALADSAAGTFDDLAADAA